jgi:hypothetical protein
MQSPAEQRCLTIVSTHGTRMGTYFGYDSSTSLFFAHTAMHLSMTSWQGTLTDAKTCLSAGARC